MAEFFGNDAGIRGCFSVYLTKEGQSHGAVLELPGQSGGEYPSTYSDPFLVVGFAAVQSESVSFTKVFGGRVYTYAFGHDPRASTMEVQMMGFLVNKHNYSHVVETLNTGYRDGRVSTSLQYAKLGLGMGTGATPLRGFVIGLSTNTTDPMHSMQQFTVRLALPEVQ